MRFTHTGRAITSRKFVRLLALAAICCLAPQASQAYSVQTHEQLIDLAWKGSIVPLLRSRFPNITTAQLSEAHAYAYGGSAVQDLGYYPFGKPIFSDLTHYVRAGDFVTCLLRDARTPDELAFAVGALSHYIGDVEGHSIAVNPSVAIGFPRLESRFGPVVTYEDNPHAHVRTEFAFDIDEIAHHRFAPSAYLEHVGLRVAVPLLERAFFETYGLSLANVLGSPHRPTLPGYEFAVRHFLPRIAYAEVVLHRHHMPADTPGPDLTELESELKQSDFENGWDRYRRHAGLGTYTLAGLIFILPKVGTLSELAIKIPDATTEDLYVKSLNHTTAVFRQTLASLAAPNPAAPPLGSPNIEAEPITNRDLDTGQVVRPGRYRLTDRTYAELLAKLTHDPANPIPAGLKSDVLGFYANPDAPNTTKSKPKQWARVQRELPVLATMKTVPEI